jgi:hypothetical protein
MDLLQKNNLAVPSTAQEDFVMSGMDDAVFANEEQCHKMQAFLDSVIRESKSSRKLSLSPSTSFDASSAVKLGLGALSPFDSSKKTGKRLQFESTSEVRLRIDLDDE